MNAINIKFFEELKNKNITKLKILELFSNVSKEISDIKEIKKHNKDLLFFSCFNDNSTLFDFLTENYKNDFKDSYKECILFTYVNKNPIILKTALSALENISTEDKETYIERFSMNCYREENVNIVLDWIKNTLNENEMEKFILNLFKYNNKPFLERAVFDELLSPKILNIKLNSELEGSTQKYLFRYKKMNIEKYYSSLQTKTQEEQLDLQETEFSNQNPQKENQGLVIRKRKKTFNTEV